MPREYYLVSGDLDCDLSFGFLGFLAILQGTLCQIFPRVSSAINTWLDCLVSTFILVFYSHYTAEILSKFCQILVQFMP